MLIMGQKENYKYLEIFEVDTIKQAKPKEKVTPPPKKISTADERGGSVVESY